MKRWLAHTAVLAFAAAALACGRDMPSAPADAGANKATQPTSGSGQPDPTQVLSITPNALVLQVGATGQLTASIIDANGRIVSVPTGPLPWTSSNSAVVTVSDVGLVSAVGAGEATVTTTAGGFTGSARVLVSR